MYYFLAVIFLLMAAPSYAQDPSPKQVTGLKIIKQISPGCTLTWEEPMIDDPSTPEVVDFVGVWELAGDLEGFQIVINRDSFVWVPANIHLVEKTLRSIACSIIGVEAEGNYFAMIKSYDTSGNASQFVGLAVHVTIDDIDPPFPVANICITGTFQGKPVRFCGTIDIVPTP